MVGGATSGPIILAASRMVVPLGTSMVTPSIVTFGIITSSLVLVNGSIGSNVLRL